MARQGSTSSRPTNARRVYSGYENRGQLKRKQSSGRFLRFLLGTALPYFLINGIILFLVIARPEVQAEEPDTTDYQSATLHFSVRSVLPLRELSASLEGETLEPEKNGSGYLITARSNGTLTLRAKAWNGMTDVQHVPINLLDEAAPIIDESTVQLGSGYLEFQVSDTQSGVDFDSIYGSEEDGSSTKPVNINKSSGIVTFSMKGNSLTVYVKDLAGNEIPASFSLN